MSATTYVYLCADQACTTVWASTMLVPPTPGTYTVYLTLPESLPNVQVNTTSNSLVGYAVVSAAGVTQFKGFAIAPKVKVSPIETSPVDPFGNHNTVTIKFLGYIPGDTITTVQFKGPITVNYTTSVTVGSDGTASTTIDLVNLTGYGLPRGTYSVLGIATQTNLTYAKAGTLSIVPQVVITPREGNGRCDAQVCELQGITITGYGFDPNVAVTKIDLWNINFTNVRYTFSVGATTNDYGYFTVSNLAQYLKTNMTAGLYVPIVYEAPLPQTLTNSSYILLGESGTVVISQSAIASALGTRASITAKSYVAGTLGYVQKASTMAYTLTEVLRISIQVGSKTYQLAANVENATAKTVRFALYNTTTLPYVTLFNTTTTAQLNSDIGAYVADIWFNIAQNDYTLTQPSVAGEYRYWASFYIYPNQILLVLREWGLTITSANLTITYTNADTGTTITKLYVYPTNMSVTDTIVSIPTLKFTDAGIEWTITWSYDASAGIATLTVTGEPTTGPSFTFRNVYYIVRPILVVLTSGVIRPGDTITVAAYGYAPGKYWGHIPPGYDDNYLDVYWEKIRLLTTVRLGKDGNATFQVTIPSDATFGVHYLWGIDKWGYEYSEAIIVGAKAYWTMVYPPPFKPPAKVEPKVSAGYNNQRIVVCPCDTSLGVKGVSYCAKVVTYGGMCDYLGDIVRIVVTGVSPGEMLTVYFGTIQVKTVTANTSTVTIEFVVPTVPEGNYNITVVGSVSGTIIVTDFYNYTTIVPNTVPYVYPKIMLLDLEKDVAPVLVGPGFVRVIGTGFTPGTTILSMLINDTDAAYTLNMQVQKWTADSNGVLVSPFTPKLGLFIPALEPGAYAISLAYAKPGTAAQVGQTMSGYVFVVNNVSILTTKDDLSNAIAVLAGKIDTATNDIKNSIASLQQAVTSQLSGISDTLKSISSTLNSVASSVSAVSSKIDTLSSKIDSISNAVNGVSSKVDNVATKVDAVNSAVNDVKNTLSSLSSAISDLKSAVTTISNAANTINSNVGALSSKLDSIASSVSDVANKISDLSGKVATKDDVNALAGKVSDLSSKVDSATSTLSSKIDTVSGKVDGVTSKVDTAASAISSKIDSATSTLQTYVIIALILALIAAVGSIYAAIQLGRKLAS
jgi:archaellum component FlaC